MDFIFLYPLCILSLVIYLIFLRYTNFYKYTKISTEVALKIHTILIIFYTICLILLFVYTVIYCGAKVVAEGLEVVYHQLDPELKKQLLEAAGVYKNPPDNPTSEHLMDSNKQIQESLGDKNLADKSTTKPTICSPVEKGDTVNQQPVDQGKVVDQLQKGPPITKFQFYEDWIGKSVRKYGVNIITKNSTLENQQTMRHFAELGPQGGLTCDHLRIVDKTSESQPIFTAPVDLSDPNSKQVTTQEFTCVNPAKSFDSYVKLREAAGVPIPVEEKSHRKSGALFIRWL